MGMHGAHLLFGFIHFFEALIGIVNGFAIVFVFLEEGGDAAEIVLRKKIIYHTISVLLELGQLGS